MARYPAVPSRMQIEPELGAAQQLDLNVVPTKVAGVVFYSLQLLRLAVHGLAIAGWAATSVLFVGSDLPHAVFDASHLVGSR
jgi:hypothetical protein